MERACSISGYVIRLQDLSGVVNMVHDLAQIRYMMQYKGGKKHHMKLRRALGLHICAIWK